MLIHSEPVVDAVCLQRGSPDGCSFVCQRTEKMDIETERYDVTVVGGGLAGMAASIHLARAGMRVVCIEADPQNPDPVGESLDWSAPALLHELDLPMDLLLDQGVATWKRHVILKLMSGAAQHYVPSDWLARPPFNIELRTIHVDRTMLNGLIRAGLVQSGATLLQDRVTEVERCGRRVTAVRTEAGRRFASAWFLDASGSAASLFPRAFALQAIAYGPRKVALWDYFAVDEAPEGTTLLADCEGAHYMDWVWQIPIHPRKISVGYVATGDSIRDQRQQGLSTQAIYANQLLRFPDLRRLSAQGAGSMPRTTSYHCRAFKKLAGPNWMVMGEAAAMIDPMTSYGVTGALRHASEASRVILGSRGHRRISWIARTLYQWRALAMAKFFNCGIEKVVYDWPLRNRLGPLTAGDVYTVPAWSMNHLYTRWRPQGPVCTILFCLALRTLRLVLDICYWFCCRSRAVAPAGTA